MTSNEDLDHVNDEMAITLLPAIILVVIYMLLGLFGNSLTAFYYGYHTKLTSTHLFIVVLSMFDMMSCCISMPLEIVDMRNSFKFTNTIACKTLRFVNYFASISSATVLLAIAVDRFRKICHPFENQITIKKTKNVIIVICMFSICVSCPSLVLYGSEKINITGIVGHDCTTVRDIALESYIMIYNVVLIVLFLITVISIIALYSVVGRTLYKLKRLRIKAKRGRSTSKYIGKGHSDTYTGSSSHANEMLDLAENKTFEATNELNTKDVSERTISSMNDLQSTLSTSIQSEMTNSKSTSKIKEDGSHVCIEKIEEKLLVHKQNIEAIKYTIIMLSITVVFIVSFLPFLILISWRTTKTEHEYELFSGPGQVAYQIAIRSFLISSAVNPLLYGFFNTEFRSYVKGKIRRLCYRGSVSFT